ncbi:hypothetical protein EJ05DRAFT_488287 [Pseudovirgaria hyperparasitica]|uniref:Uncharacterized protein n=1 Tax=Pseudovirgaria hyperparasitica TaxID=470096 RepID=A0A6A6W0B7_9PEZI|nr:uncharacterized protein EJ05DRAFT_488287 [Pseudovirgaria hyperparasitica]KAF2755536.1 hypothetical protein EJ05DRAFT_488287 [Pseudovirgaria hyperparasitica]
MFSFLVAQPARTFQQRLTERFEGHYHIVPNPPRYTSPPNIRSTFTHGTDLHKRWKSIKDHQYGLKTRYTAEPFDKNDIRNPPQEQYIAALNELHASAVEGLQQFTAKSDRLALQLTPLNGKANCRGWQRMYDPIVESSSCERILDRLQALGSGYDIYSCRGRLPPGRSVYRVTAYMHLLCISAAVALLNDENFLDGDNRNGSDFSTVGSWLLQPTSKPQLKKGLELFSVFCASRNFDGLCPFFMLYGVPFGAHKQLAMLVGELDKHLKHLTVLMDHDDR